MIFTLADILSLLWKRIDGRRVIKKRVNREDSRIRIKIRRDSKNRG